MKKTYADEYGYRLARSMWNALDTFKQMNPDFSLDDAKEKLESVFDGWSKHNNAR